MYTVFFQGEIIIIYITYGCFFFLFLNNIRRHMKKDWSDIMNENIAVFFFSLFCFTKIKLYNSLLQCHVMTSFIIP